jgi:solute carrier family 30 (zinc transporter), member 1
MNMHGVFLHILADALGSVVVIISSLIIKFVPHDTDDHKHWTVYVDPTLSLIIVIIITISSIPLLKDSTFILLQTVPEHIEVVSLKKQLIDQVPEIDGIHEFHVWRLTSNTIIASAHLHLRSLSDYMLVADKVKRFFHGVGIHSTTMQYEYQNNEYPNPLMQSINESGFSKPASECLLRCVDDSCDKQTCCTKDSIRINSVLNTVSSDGMQKRLANTIEE